MVAGGEPVVAFVADPADTGASQAAAGVDRTVALGDDGMRGADAEALVVALEQACRQEDAELLALPSTVEWREVAAVLAVRLDGAASSEVTALRRDADGTLLADRLLYSGLVVATVALLARPAVVTVPLPDAPQTVPDVLVEGGEPADRGARVLVSRVRRQADPNASEGESAGLSGAGRVVAVGRGLRRREDLEVVEELCEALGAALAGSRPLVEDFRWLPPDRQVGLSGHVVRPELYVAVGISGQIQHLVGMRDSGVVVAINADPKAPIFDAADVGIVGDLYEVVPRLTGALTARARGS